MKLTEHKGWSGLVVVTVVGPDGEVRRRDTIKNLITDAALNMQRDALQGVITDMKMKYIALGTGSTAPASGDTKLVAEGHRQAISNYTDPGIGQMFTQVLLTSGNGNMHIQEIGWFAGADATGDADTGTLVARILYDYDKTVDESVYINRTDTIQRG